jgi:integrase
MARSEPVKTRYEGVYVRELASGKVYDYRYTGVDGKGHWCKPRGIYRSAIEARDARAERIREVRGGIVRAESVTLRDFAPRWLAKLDARVVNGEIRSSTADGYRRDLETALGVLGDLHLRRIGVEQIEGLRDTLEARGTLANSTVRRIMTTVGYPLELAVKWGRIDFNPVRLAELPPVHPHEPELPTLADIARLRACARRGDEKRYTLSPSDGRMIQFMAIAGTRPSETYGLRLPNIDLTPGAERVFIVEQVYQGARIDQTKTRAGSREVILAPTAAALLREQLAALMVDGYTDLEGPVFPSPKGTPWRASNFNRRVWQPTREAAGLPDLLLKTLRNFHISYVRGKSGLPASVTEQLVGHEDERTHRGYTRPVEGQQAMIRDGLDRAFGGEAS